MRSKYLIVNDLLLMLALIIFSDLSEARVYKTKFEPVKNLSIEHQRAAISSVQINIDSDDGISHCTGTFISKTGLLLTARHCIQSCIIPMLSTLEEPFNVMATYPDENFFKGKKCRVQVRGFEYEDAEIVTVGGKGFVDETDIKGKLFEIYLAKTNPIFYRRMSAEGYFFAGDFAVLKFDKSRVKTCSPFSIEKKIEQVTVFSYPRPTERPDGMNSNGKDQFISRGMTKKSYLNECSGKLSDEDRSSFNLTNSSDDLIFFTADFVSGSSGAAIFNKHGQIVGLGNSSRNSETKECVGSSAGVSSKAIKDFLSHKIDENTKKEIEDCSAESI